MQLQIASLAFATVFLCLCLDQGGQWVAAEMPFCALTRGELVPLLNASVTNECPPSFEAVDIAIADGTSYGFCYVGFEQSESQP